MITFATGQYGSWVNQVRSRPENGILLENLNLRYPSAYSRLGNHFIQSDDLA